MTADDLIELARRAASFEEQRNALAALLVERELSDETVARVLDHVRDGILLVDSDGDAAGQLGGQGLVPRGEPWPIGATGAPLTFIGAIDLAQVPTLAPLPPDGTLLIYWDHDFHRYESMDFVAATKVYYAPAGSGVDQLDPPTAAWGSFDRIPITGLPMPIAGEADKVLRSVGTDRDLLIETMNEIDRRVYNGHQLLGSSRDIQGPVLDSIPYWIEQTAQVTQERFSESERAGTGWLLLAQINEDSGLVLGDGGALYFVIPETDLRDRRFDRVMGIMECH